MQRSNDIDLMVVASLMPTPDGLLLLAALDGWDPAGHRPRPAVSKPSADATGLALLLSVATLTVGLLALLPAIAWAP
ncbi:hypothetical protein [Azospirillum doebereinerae]|uniref:Uncharacterized protein n=1 Tax=Azospirillum doebereinerae TaxID=92933 RepID=A0A3S0UY60_9PROT|nr:hypothetical protein [Azospirillum doebereinerae]MCG5240507.1 hypothetical protein [Azospirillum doebereinerae]RUQ63691.1 hypothetical protein EJ913_27540 [Azospirillum doebereinerae]